MSDNAENINKNNLNSDLEDKVNNSESDINPSENNLIEINESSNEMLDDSESDILIPAQPANDQDELSRKFENIYDLLLNIDNNISKKMKYDKTKETAFEKLYHELDELKRNKTFDDNRAFYKDLVLFYDRLKSISDEQEPPFNKILESFQYELLEILSRREIEIIDDQFSDFNPIYQKVIEKIVVVDEKLDKKVIKKIREGFIYREIVIRPQEVVLGDYITNDQEGKLTKYKSENTEIDDPDDIN